VRKTLFLRDSKGVRPVLGGKGGGFRRRKGRRESGRFRVVKSGGGLSRAAPDNCCAMGPVLG